MDRIYSRLDHNKDGKVNYVDFSQVYDDKAGDKLQQEPTYRSEKTDASLCWGSPLRKSPVGAGVEVSTSKPVSVAMSSVKDTVSNQNQT